MAPSAVRRSRSQVAAERAGHAGHDPDLAEAVDEAEAIGRCGAAPGALGVDAPARAASAG